MWVAPYYEDDIRGARRRRSAPTTCCSGRTGRTPRAWPSRPTSSHDLDGFSDDEVRLIMRDNGLALAQRI